MTQYKASMNDPNLLELRNEISLIDAQIADILGDLEDRIPDNQWQEMVTYWIEFMAAIRANDAKKQTEMVMKLDAAFDKGTNYRSNLDRVNKLIAQRSRLVSSEVKNRAITQQMLAVEIVIALITKLAIAVKESVAEHAAPDVAKKIIWDTNLEYKRLVGAKQE